MFCRKCGNSLKPDARFCTKCGLPVAPRAPPADPPSLPLSQPEPERPPETEPVVAGGAPGVAAEPPEPEPGAPTTELVQPEPEPNSGLPVPEVVIDDPTPAWSDVHDSADGFVAKPDRRPLYAAAVALVLVAAAGGAWYTGKIGGRPAGVAAELNAELASSGITGVVISVDRDWNATLTGEVTDIALHDRALSLVQANKDVKSVQDKILVRNPDVERLAAAVRSLAEVGANGISGRLDPQGRVLVEGGVDSQAQKDMLLAAVTGAIGKEMVVDGLSPSIRWRAAEAGAALSNAGMADVQVLADGNDGLVIMGSVDSVMASNLAEQLVRATGVPRVRNGLSIVAQAAPAPAASGYANAPIAQQARPLDPRSNAGSTIPAAMIGKWGGRVQVGFLFKATYAMHLDLQPGRIGSVVGTATYARMRKGSEANPVQCRSTLVLDDVSDGVVRVLERVQGSGDWLCAASGRMAMILDNGALSLGWDRQGYAGKPMRGQITRNGSTTDGQTVTLGGY